MGTHKTQGINGTSSSGRKNEDDENPSAEKNKDKKPKRKRVLWQRILFTSLKVIFIWIPLFVVTIVALTLVVVDIYLSPARVQRLAIEKFNAQSNGTLTLDVKKFSPYSEILIENLIIKNPKEFGEGNFLEIKKISFRYGFFSMLIGRVHFDEIGIYKPRVYLLQKKGVWNVSKLMKAGEVQAPPVAVEKPVEEKAPPVKEAAKAPARTSIKLPWAMRFFFNFVLDDFYCYVRGDTFRAELGGVAFHLKIDVPPFREIPLDVTAVKLLKNMEISLNPEERIDLTFVSQDAAVEPPLIMSWKLLFNKGTTDSTAFSSSFKFGTYRTPVRFKQSHLAPLDFLVSYDLYYDPVSDYLKLNDFGVRFRGQKWIGLGGTVREVTKNPVLDIRMNESRIVLGDLYPYYRALTKDENLRFAGNISLAPLSVTGTPDRLTVKGGLRFSSIAVKLPEFGINIPSLNLDYDVGLNGASGKIGARLLMPGFSYTMDRGVSGQNALSLTADVDTFSNFGRFRINKVNLRFYDPRKRTDALSLGVQGAVTVKPAVAGDISIVNMVFRKDALLSTLPESMRKGIAAIPLEKPVTLNMNSSFELGDPTSANVTVSVKVPDYEMNDLTLRANVVQHASAARIDLKSVVLESPARGLSLTVKGFVETKKQPLSNSDLSLALSVKYPKMTPVYGPWDLSGTVMIKASMKGDLATGKAKGSVKIDDLSVNNKMSMLDVAGLNLDFPFEYDFAFKPSGDSRLALDKGSLIDSSLFKEKQNFSIRSIAAKHPAREQQFVYLRDLGGTLFFRNNSFEIQKLSASVLDGTFFAKDIFFYLSDLKVKNMEYALTLDVTNVDVGLLDVPDPKNKSHDAELSLNAKIAGKNLDFSKELNVSGSVNIFRIGSRFANKLMKGLSQEKGKSKLGIAQPVVDHTAKPTGFYFYIDKGIMYPEIVLKRKALGIIVNIENDKVKFDRVPIQEYLRKVQE
jgi:hypothetical protein